MEGTVSSLCHPNQDLGSRRRSVRILLPENDMPARRIGEIYLTVVVFVRWRGDRNFPP